MGITDELFAVRNLISQGWAQRDYAYKANGDGCGSFDPDAVCWCINGAMNRAKISDPTRALIVSRTPKPYQYIADFNDAPSRTHEEVLAFIDSIIKEVTA